MRRLTFVRTAALVAIAGGLLRIAGSFAPVAVHSELARESLYVVIDACLTVGLIGFYVQRSNVLRWPGAMGLGVALVGIAMVRANRVLATVDLYPLGALAIVGGAIVLTWRARADGAPAAWVPGAFLLSAALGIVGSVVDGSRALFIGSGVVFGMAFAALGMQMRTHRK